MPPKNVSLLSKELFNELNQQLNKNIDLTKIAAHSGKKYWWICKKGHDFEATASHRSNGVGCSYCAGKKVLQGFNDLKTAYPEIASEWHPTKNGSLTSSSILKSTNLKVWWVDKYNHEWQTSVLKRTYYNTGCPICSNRQVLVNFNDVATTHPHIAKNWNFKLNGDIKPTQITKGYAKKVWLHCDNNHLVNVLVGNCLSNISCLYCSGKKTLEGFNDVASTHPFISKFWHPTKNENKTPENTTRGYGQKIWWTCKNNHEYLSLISNRINVGDRCSYCDGQKIIVGENDLATTNPVVAAQWHPTLNGSLTPSMFSHGSSAEIWWLCAECGEAQKSVISNRTKNPMTKGCSTCLGRTIKIGFNDLNTTFPLIAKEIHPTKNNGLIGEQLTAGSDKTIWWLCDAMHEYEAKINDRTRKNNGCNKCYRLGLPTNAFSFKEKYPELVKEWDIKKNLPFTPETTATYSNRKSWWICEENHSWVSTVSSRTYHDSGCPICWKAKNASLPEIEITNFLVKLGVIVESNTRKYLDGKELDIYLPEHKLAIEYNGLYWHSEAAGKDNKYHQMKTRLAAQKDIELFHVWEDDWVLKREIILRHIAHRIGKTRNLKDALLNIDEQYTQTFFARKLNIEKITYVEAASFLSETHIQGQVKGSHYFGLKNSGDKLCAVLVLAKTDTPKELLISRYSTKGIVPGGFTKLLKYIIKTIQPERIITFADLAISNGSLYENSGFFVEKNLPPDYMYIKNKKRYHKFGFRLKSFKNNPELFFYPNMTEKKLAEVNGYTRIWDSGKTKYAMLVADKFENGLL